MFRRRGVTIAFSVRLAAPTARGSGACATGGSTTMLGASRTLLLYAGSAYGCTAARSLPIQRGNVLPCSAMAATSALRWGSSESAQTAGLQPAETASPSSSAAVQVCDKSSPTQADSPPTESNRTLSATIIVFNEESRKLKMKVYLTSTKTVHTKWHVPDEYLAAASAAVPDQRVQLTVKPKVAGATETLKDSIASIDFNPPAATAASGEAEQPEPATTVASSLRVLAGTFDGFDEKTGEMRLRVRLGRGGRKVPARWKVPEDQVSAARHAKAGVAIQVHLPPKSRASLSESIQRVVFADPAAATAGAGAEGTTAVGTEILDRRIITVKTAISDEFVPETAIRYFAIGSRRKQLVPIPNCDLLPGSVVNVTVQRGLRDQLVVLSFSPTEGEIDAQQLAELEQPRRQALQAGRSSERRAPGGSAPVSSKQGKKNKRDRRNQRSERSVTKVTATVSRFEGPYVHFQIPSTDGNSPAKDLGRCWFRSFRPLSAFLTLSEGQAVECAMADGRIITAVVPQAAASAAAEAGVESAWAPGIIESMEDNVVRICASAEGKVLQVRCDDSLFPEMTSHFHTGMPVIFQRASATTDAEKETDDSSDAAADVVLPANSVRLADPFGFTTELVEVSKAVVVEVTESGLHRARADNDQFVYFTRPRSSRFQPGAIIRELQIWPGFGGGSKAQAGEAVVVAGQFYVATEVRATVHSRNKGGYILTLHIPSLAAITTTTTTTSTVVSKTAETSPNDVEETAGATSRFWSDIGLTDGARAFLPGNAAGRLTSALVNGAQLIVDVQVSGRHSSRAHAFMAFRPRFGAGGAAAAPVATGDSSAAAPTRRSHKGADQPNFKSPPPPATPVPRVALPADFIVVTEGARGRVARVDGTRIFVSSDDALELVEIRRVFSDSAVLSQLEPNTPITFDLVLPPEADASVTAANIALA